MPAYGQANLSRALMSAISESGHSAAVVSNLTQQPRKLIIRDGISEIYDAWVYIWTLTAGQRGRREDEYRIQTTTSNRHLEINPIGLTLLLGYSPDLDVFAGFDIRLHQQAGGTRGARNSNSLQINLDVLREGLTHGLAFKRKTNNELVAAIRPDQLMTYAKQVSLIHDVASSPGDFAILSRAAEVEPITDEEILRMAAGRRKVVQTVTKLSRDARFRKQVLFAYENRCAVTRAQLRLVDAAHVLPVGSPGSIDHVTNGVALSPTIHRAFDNGLIYLTTDYEMCVNEAHVSALRDQNLVAGIEEFSRPLGRIFLPPDPNQRIREEFITSANKARMIA